MIKQRVFHVTLISFCALQRGLDCIPHPQTHPWGCMCSVGSNVNEIARILFLGWTNQIEIIIGSFASLEVGYKVNVLWLPPIATSSLSKLKDLWFSFEGIQDFSLQLSWFFYFAFCQYLLQGAIRAGMKNLKGETHRCHSILELKGNSLWFSGLKW